jgi:hypothetical protein
MFINVGLTETWDPKIHWVIIMLPASHQNGHMAIYTKDILGHVDTSKHSHPSSKILGQNGSWRLVRSNLSTEQDRKTRWSPTQSLTGLAGPGGTSTPLTMAGMAGTVALACPLSTNFSVFQWLSVAGSSSVSWAKTDHIHTHNYIYIHIYQNQIKIP